MSIRNEIIAALKLEKKVRFHFGAESFLIDPAKHTYEANAEALQNDWMKFINDELDVIFIDLLKVDRIEIKRKVGFL